MRTIKYRVWGKTHKRFLPDANNCAIFPNGTIYCLNGLIQNLDDFVIEQFTGLTDANGKEIFEGDILKEDGSDFPFEMKFGDWNCGCCSFVYGYCMGNGAAAADYEVIGNVHQNPELLKK